jgi:hypothetical protein
LTIPDDDPVLGVDAERDVAARLFDLVWDLLDPPRRERPMRTS